jgi:hypothetical protein
MGDASVSVGTDKDDTGVTCNTGHPKTKYSISVVGLWQRPESDQQTRHVIASRNVSVTDPCLTGQS